MNRNEYVRKLKADLALWNEQIDAWEARLVETRGALRPKLRAYLESWRDRRNLVAQRLREVQNAAGAGWDLMACGADDPWRILAQDYQRARRELKPGAQRRRPR